MYVCSHVFVKCAVVLVWCMFALVLLQFSIWSRTPQCLCFKLTVIIVAATLQLRKLGFIELGLNLDFTLLRVNGKMKSCMCLIQFSGASYLQHHPRSVVDLCLPSCIPKEVILGLIPTWVSILLHFDVPGTGITYTVHIKIINNRTTTGISSSIFFVLFCCLALSDLMVMIYSGILVVCW